MHGVFALGAVCLRVCGFVRFAARIVCFASAGKVKPVTRIPMGVTTKTSPAMRAFERDMNAMKVKYNGIGEPESSRCITVDKRGTLHTLRVGGCMHVRMPPRPFSAHWWGLDVDTDVNSDMDTNMDLGHVAIECVSWPHACLASFVIQHPPTHPTRSSTTAEDRDSPVCCPHLHSPPVEPRGSHLP